MFRSHASEIRLVDRGVSWIHLAKFLFLMKGPEQVYHLNSLVSRVNNQRIFVLEQWEHLQKKKGVAPPYKVSIVGIIFIAEPR